MIKVLWVCNIMLPLIAEHLQKEASNKEGWLSGLCESILAHHVENCMELHVAYPIANVPDGSAYDYHKIEFSQWGGKTVLYAYGFAENVGNAQVYDPALEEHLAAILQRVQPDVIHCFGTEYAHTLAVVRACRQPQRLLIGLQGLCSVIAEAYMADLPEEIQRKVTFRDWLKKDSILQQQQKFALRGEREREIIRLAGNITGRTAFDRHYTEQWNPRAAYYTMNETLRACFYEGRWQKNACEPHTIFISQGDYPLKGLHYLLLAAARLREDYPDIRIKVAGNSIVNWKSVKDKIKISAYGVWLRRLMEQYALQERVEFLGRLTAEQMKEAYLSCGIYVCCSSNENSPNSLGEAMLLGVPCAAADVGGISSIFFHEEDGILYEGYRLNENNKCYSIKSGLQEGKKEGKFFAENGKNFQLERVSENLAAAIARIWEHPAETEEYCNNARKHARKTHDKEANYQRMTEIYAEIAAKASQA